jgi:N-acetylmuramoyl-L-alanine amidase
MRVGPQDGGDLRLVVELTAPATAKIFTVEPTAGLGHRLVVDLFPTGKKSSGSSGASAPTIVKAAPQGQARDIVIAIDAGHGGTDPGSIGRNGTYEKNVTLAIARVLKARIDQEPGMRAVLTRDTDVFLPLRERINRARDRKADMFVSIHADAYHDRSVTGSSVYVLSARGASDEASRWLAQRENAADLIGGVSLEDKDDVLASVLLDLSQGASMSASIEAADTVLRELRNVGNIKRATVQSAGFLVLKSPDIPSMLVETAFITNPQEEKKLSNPTHQQKLAGAIHAGIRSYFYDNPPPGTRIAQLRGQLQAGAIVATADDDQTTGASGAGISH